ncbi:SDR family NAD(P)-dependent oxidoreductase [Amycolatopsis japonica]|uniref:SDR family NAD(P)-dependent oxidoreductase n=1 Tax=Amycolatopsis japonica TaxID=208439 RepID=UPI0033304F74
MTNDVPARTALVTGGTGGIGLHTAIGLAAAGYDVTVVGRDAARGAAARVSIERAVPGARARFVPADLATLAEVRSLARSLRSRGLVDVLVNNVSGLFRERCYTGDGIEATFALSHLSGYLLTELLVGDMVLAGRGRIVTVTSGAIDLADPTGFDQADVAGRFYGMTAYGRAKLANLAYMAGLANRLHGTGVTVLAADPGTAGTDTAKSMRSDLFPFPARLAWPLIWLNVRRMSVAQAARSSVLAATSDSYETGQVVTPRGQGTAPHPRAADPSLIEAVHTLSARLAAVPRA